MPRKEVSARREYQRWYKQENKEKLREKNRDYDRKRNANLRAELHGVEGRLTLEEVRQIMAAGNCHYCGREERLTLDHVVPLSKGGENRPENIVCSCRWCNASKCDGERPWGWSTLYDHCVICGRNDSAHESSGRCARCIHRLYYNSGEPYKKPNPAFAHVKEKDFQKQVEQLAEVRGWDVYHTRHSVGSHPGFPDLAMLRVPRMVFAELKSESGRLSTYQQDWIRALSGHPGMEVYVWRPSDWDAIEEVIR
jgi:hypothetical protein